MPEKLRGIEQLHSQNHDLWRKVQKCVALKMKWEDIASECGLIGPSAVKELCDWCLAYKEPKRPPMVRAKPITMDTGLGFHRMDDREQARKFLVWRRQNEAAREALEEIRMAELTEALSQPQ